MYLALYVDDGLIFARDEMEINQLIDYLKTNLKVKTFGAACFIVIQIERLGDGSIFLHQESCVKRILDKFHMTDSKAAATPLENNHNIHKPEVLAGELVDAPYQEAMGSILYCAMATRPDISYAMSVLGKYSSQPRKEHWTAIKRVLRYLNGTRGHGLLYRKVHRPGLVCYTDSDWAGDQQNRRPTSGMITFISNEPVSFKAQQQPIVAISTTEAEYVSSTLGVIDIIWLQGFIKELGVDINQVPQLLCDNQSALKLIKNPEFHPRTKHIDIQYHFARERYEMGDFTIEYVNSEEQKADIFTKALTGERFKKLRASISCVNPKADID